MIFIKCHLVQPNFMGQLSFQLSFLANTLYQKCRHWMREYNQSWFESIWEKRNVVLINEIWQKNS